MQDWQKIKDKKRIVIKVGTSTLTYPTGKLNFQRIEKLSMVLSDLRNRGKEVLLVSSGAIGVGAGRLGLNEKPTEISKKQALAAIGQAELIKIYQKFFDNYNQIVAQVLLTKDGIAHTKRKLNAKNTLFTLLHMGIIPIINENDTVAIDEIVFGDNDTLSADVSVLIEAGLLILLSDIDGLFDEDPRKNPKANLLTKVEEINEEIEYLAKGEGSSFSTGGMVTKISAAKTCAKANIDTVITNGADPSIIFDILEGKEKGTLFVSGKIKEKLAGKK
ncbi:MAG: glutamate 5-kinase [Bacteroidota bacterium]